LEIRHKLVEDRSVDVIVSVGPNFFYTVTLPCTLWFLDKAKRTTDRADQVLFIDARKTYRQIDRAHRDFLPEQIEFLANITRLYRGEKPEDVGGSGELMAEHFQGGEYLDVPGLCQVATLEEIEAQGWSLNPGRYVGITAGKDDGVNFDERMAELESELEQLTSQAHGLEEVIIGNLASLREGSM
jgi:type I restriction enzyme M protein